MMSNRYPGKCEGCGKKVNAREGILEHKYGRKWLVWHPDCFDRSDHSSYEDRCCGYRAYEDACARACGFDDYY